MPFKTCEWCDKTYNIVSVHDCPYKPEKVPVVKIKKPKKDKPIKMKEKFIKPKKPSKGFKAYLERFGITRLK